MTSPAPPRRGTLVVVAVIVTAILVAVSAVWFVIGVGRGSAEEIGGAVTEESTADQVSECLVDGETEGIDACRFDAAALVLDDFWRGEVYEYRAPTLVLVEGVIDTGCGPTDDGAGTFYCPGDETVYIEEAFLDTLENEGLFGQDLASLYFLAHSWAHHVQHISGLDADRPLDGPRGNRNAASLEFEADCFAGTWLRETTRSSAEREAYLVPLTQDRIRAALSDVTRAVELTEARATDASAAPEPTPGSSIDPSAAPSIGPSIGSSAEASVDPDEAAEPEESIDPEETADEETPEPIRPRDRIAEGSIDARTAAVWAGYSEGLGVCADVAEGHSQAVPVGPAADDTADDDTDDEDAADED